MSRNLFLEGPIQTGKSTLIRSVLGERLRACGGFACQRLKDGGGNTLGFSIGPAADTPLTGPFSMSAPGLFAYPGPDGARVMDPEFFLTSAPALLEVPDGCRLMLLDEIGGIELLCDPFREALLHLLQSDVPCLGVLKARENAARMSARTKAGECPSPDAGEDTAAPAPSLLQRYDQLRGLIEEDEDSRILFFDRTGSQASVQSVCRELESFLDEVFR